MAKTIRIRCANCNDKTRIYFRELDARDVLGWCWGCWRTAVRISAAALAEQGIVR